jgi:glycosyltransferase involved in cell wall biosynthesis
MVDAGMSELWVVPALDGPCTGGTLYNRELIAALRARNVSCDVLTLREFLDGGAARSTARVWLDSLYLPHTARVREHAPSLELGLLMHYLPSRVLAEDGSAEQLALREQERGALQHASRCLVPSPTLLAELAPIAEAARAFCVEPGVNTVARADRSDPPATAHALRAIVIANLTPNKDVLALLRALAAATRDDDRFTLSIIGSEQLDVAYATQCRELAHNAPQLRARVRLHGALPHREVLARLASSDLLVSASRTESYGMALAEARAAGVPILARAGGHVAAHVDEQTGGELVENIDDLASALLRAARDVAAMQQRRAAASSRRHVRSWDDAARDFLAAL